MRGEVVHRIERDGVTICVIKKLAPPGSGRPVRRERGHDVPKRPGGRGRPGAR
jgi:hypothetical protein